jgi:hypothetical protein
MEDRRGHGASTRQRHSSGLIVSVRRSPVVDTILAGMGVRFVRGPLKELLVPYPADQMRMWEISPRINSPKNDDPSL